MGFPSHTQKEIEFKSLITEYLKGEAKNLNSLKLKESPVGFKPWKIPYDMEYRGYYNSFIVSTAKLCKVKVMYRSSLDSETLEIKTWFWVIGEEGNIKITTRILDKVFKRVFMDILLGNKKTLTSNTFIKYANIYADIVNNLLDVSTTYTHWLESIIIDKYSLDFKDYHGTKRYEHTKSKKFHHKRMML